MVAKMAPGTGPVKIKICGLSTAAAVAQSVGDGAAYVGLVFYPPSPRSLELAAASELARLVPAGVTRVALLVDPEDSFLDQLVAEVPIDMLQLHGHETPQRVAEIRARTNLPVMKVIGIRDAADLPQIAAYEAVADQLLIDAKPPSDGAGYLPGGNALTFDWRLIAGRKWACPWMLAGGLTAENVAEALRLTGARQVDVSSGVESAPGVKDLAKISAFIKAASR
jgi:phosphoribosylanthranilate isomerase